MSSLRLCLKIKSLFWDCFWQNTHGHNITHGLFKKEPVPNLRELSIPSVQKAPSKLSENEVTLLSEYIWCKAKLCSIFSLYYGLLLSPTDLFPLTSVFRVMLRELREPVPFSSPPSSLGPAIIAWPTGRVHVHVREYLIGRQGTYFVIINKLSG